MKKKKYRINNLRNCYYTSLRFLMGRTDYKIVCNCIKSYKNYRNSKVWILLDYYYNVIGDIAFELFAMHCGIGRGIRQKKIPQEKWLCPKYNKPIVSLESSHRPECICFFLNTISSITLNYFLLFLNEKNAYSFCTRWAISQEQIDYLDSLYFLHTQPRQFSR